MCTMTNLYVDFLQLHEMLQRRRQRRVLFHDGRPSRHLALVVHPRYSGVVRARRRLARSHWYRGVHVGGPKMWAHGGAAVRHFHSAVSGHPGVD